MNEIIYLGVYSTNRNQTPSLWITLVPRIECATRVVESFLIMKVASFGSLGLLTNTLCIAHKYDATAVYSAFIKAATVPL